MTPLAAQEPPADIPPARQNSILRKYFEESYFQMGFNPDTPRPFLEAFIDRQIDHFLEEVEKDLGELEEAMGRLEEQALRWRQGARNAGELGEALEEVARRCDSIRGRLSRVFTDLKDRRNLPRRLREEEPDLEKGLAFVQEQTGRALEQIRDYLFKPGGSVVRLEEIQQENMLVNLYWARSMARRLEGRLKKGRL